MTNTLILLKGTIDINKIKSITSTSDTIIYSLDYETHKFLIKNSVEHKTTDKILTQRDLDEIFDKVVSLYDWYEKTPNSSELYLEDVNILSLLDTAELHIFLANFLYDFFIVKKLIQQNNPKKIIGNSYFMKLVQPLIRNSDVLLEEFDSTLPDSMVWDSIEIKLNIGKIPISFLLSRKNYEKLKNTFERLVCSLKNLWPNNADQQKTILFLEIDPTNYEYLIKEISQNHFRVMFFNNRRSPVWNAESIKILSKYDCKVLSLNRMFTQNEKEKIRKLSFEFKNKLQKFINDKTLSEIFTFENISFWPCIKDNLMVTYEKRISQYVTLLLGAKIALQNYNVKCILSTNVVGETEKAILFTNKNNIRSVMIEHGFANYTPEIARYDILSMYALFQDMIAVWGEIQKQYILNQHKIDENRIIVSGSPRHDKFFEKSTKNNNRNTKYVLIAPRPIIDVALHKETDLFLKYEALLEKLLLILKKLNVKPIIKLHPGLDFHNNDIKKIIRKLDPTIPIYQSGSIKNLLENVDAVINISPEGFDPSTVIMESIILEIPTMNIILDQQIYDFEFVKMNAVMNVLNYTTLENDIHKIIFDNPFRQELILRGNRFLDSYLTNHGSASKFLAKKLIELCNTTHTYNK